MVSKLEQKLEQIYVLTYLIKISIKYLTFHSAIINFEYFLLVL